MIINRLNKASVDLIRAYLPQDVTDSIYEYDVSIFAGMEDDTVISVMVVRENNGVAQIGYISVADEYRQQGICMRMICEYMWNCADKDIAKLTCTLGEEEYDKYVERIMIKLGFMPESTYNSIVTTSVKDFIKSELPKVSTKGHMVMSFNELGKEGIKQAAKTLKANTAFRYTEGDLIKCNGELSFIITVNGMIKDIVMVSNIEDYLELMCMYSAKDDLAGTVILLNTLQNKVKDMPEYADSKVVIPIVNEGSKKLVTHILPECKMEKCYKMVFDFV